MNIHIIELRSSIIKSTIFTIAAFILLFFNRNELYNIIASPILAKLPQQSSLVATNITASFIAPTKLSFIAAIYLSMPFILYQLWKFISPGLYLKEKKSVLFVTIASSTLFYIGNMFAFFIIIPLALSFFTTTIPENILLMTDISNYLDFIITIIFATGCAFQVPIITKLLISANICTKQSLKQKRSYVIVGALFLGMILTPPDVISQVLLAVPIWILFELGLLISKKQ